MGVWFGETLPARLAALEARVGGGGCAVGGRLSLADIVLFSFVTQFFDNADGARQAASSSAPRIHAVVEKVASMPAIRDWLSSRPDTAF